MDDTIARRLVELNRAFYHQFAQSFAESRSKPPDGFERLLDYVPDTPGNLLDVGCGNGRLGHFLRGQGRQFRYVGVDFTRDLMDSAAPHQDDTFVVRDLSLDGCLEKLGKFETITCLSTLQHIPGAMRRGCLLQEMATQLKVGGRIILGNWQFLDSSRQRRKIVDWSFLGMQPEDVEGDDYLMSWDRGGKGVRYVCQINEKEVDSMASEVGLKVIDQFRSDGREGNLNLYSILSG